MSFVKSAQLFRQLLKSECLAIPGAYNGLVARAVADNGIFPFLTKSAKTPQVTRPVIFPVLL